MHTFMLGIVFASLAMAAGGAHARGLGTGPDTSDVCVSAASRFLVQAPNDCRTAPALDIRVASHGDHVLLLRGAGLARTGDLSFFVKGVTAADIRDRFSTRAPGTGAPIVAFLLGFWAAGLVALARLGW